MAHTRRSRLPVYLAVIVLAALTLLFFWQILLTNLILSGVDVFLYFYPYKAYTAEALRQGRLPLWNPHLFMGAPLLANSQAGLFYPPNWLFIWLDAPKQVAWSIGLHIFLAGLFMLAFARQGLRLSWPGAMLAAILFAFGGYLGAQVEHVNQLQAAAWLPLLFLFYELGLRRRRLFWFFLAAATIGLMLLAGHAQTVFISLSGLGLYAAWQAVFEPANDGAAAHLNLLSGFLARGGWSDHLRSSRRQLPAAAGSLLWSLWRYLAPLAGVCVLAVALAAVQLLPTAELSNLSIRSGGLTFREAVSFSLRPTNLHYSLLPPFNLDLTQALGEAFGEWVAYAGMSGLALAGLGLLTTLWLPPARRFLFVGGSGLLLSLGLFTGPLYFMLYQLVPGFDLFRVPARWLLLYAFGVAALAGFGLEGLLRPAELRARLGPIWRWLRGGRWRLALPLLPLLFLLALIAWKTPPATTLVAWFGLAALSLGLIGYTLRATSPGEGSQPALSPAITAALLTLLLLGELFWAARTLNYNQPTAPQAYHSLRNATAFLLANDPPDNPAVPPGRFLSLSGITYDPGDLADLRQLYGEHLSEKALYNLIVATKEKEVLFFNLPLIYGLHSVDGYDGGVLPLARFVSLQRLFLPADDLSIDGRLRENLRFVPDSRLLSLLNARWIITDKMFDVWIDGIFYDLQFPAILEPGETIATTDIPAFPPTAIGIVSHLEEAVELPDGVPVAALRVSFAGGGESSFILKAGSETAEGSYPGGEEGQAAHGQATIGVTWPYDGEGVDYITVQPLPEAGQISRISVEALLPEGRFVLRGLSLIHQPTNTSRSLLLSTEGNYRQVHSGDVKIYENQAVLPRAFVVHRAERAADDTGAIELMRRPTFEPRATIMLPAGEDEAGVETRGEPAAEDQARIVAYEPERVEIEVELASPGWLILTDAYYPGWQAAIDGRPADMLRADVLFRAVPVPAGSHKVSFEFRPASVRLGAAVSGLALLVIAVGLGMSRRR